VPSLLDLSLKTRALGWQRLTGSKPLSDDALSYVLEHGMVEDWRMVLVTVNRKLKENKQFEGAKIGGLLVVAIDANEVIAGKRVRTPKESHWRWLVSPQLDSSTGRTIELCFATSEKGKRVGQNDSRSG
jgi:hypothetical protein